MHTIAATTWSEYKKYVEKDAALARRFQVVKVEEPSETQAVLMMRGLVGRLEQHHSVRVLHEAVEAAVHLSHRYITGRQLPDKAVSVLDTACARVALGQVATPPAIEDYQRQLHYIDTEIDILGRESLSGTDCRERLNELTECKVTITSQLAALKSRWHTEKQLVETLRTRREQLEAHAKVTDQTADTRATTSSLSPAEVEQTKADIAQLTTALAELQGEAPLMQDCVDTQAIAAVVSGWTGIPVGKMLKDEIHTVFSLPQLLATRIIGQAHALETISQRIQTARASLEDPRRPIGVFLLVGPSGVGKTETALALADTLYGGEDKVVTMNMSEYQEAHTVSTLKGSPPGYVGYGEGGILTEAVRRKPYCVVLLDEMEKAHPDVLELLYQVFDKGVLEDAEGREVDFKNALMLLTSNAASATIMRLCTTPETYPAPEALVETLRPELLKVFKPALLGRMIIVPYYPITDDVMQQIIALQLARIRTRLLANTRAQFSYDQALITSIANRCTDVESGARMVDHILTRTLLPAISRALLTRMAAGETITKVHMAVGADGSLQYEIVPLPPNAVVAP